MDTIEENTNKIFSGYLHYVLNAYIDDEFDSKR